MGPLLFNVYLNVKKSGICNYADDNTVTYSHPDPLDTSESEGVIEWFDSNHMQTNPGKFRPFWVKEGTVTVRVSQYKTIKLNVKIQSNY